MVKRMEPLIADERGRITLGSDLVKECGRKFFAVKVGKEIVLVPVADDPLAELRRLGKASGIDKYTIKELRKMALEDAEKEAMRNVRGYRFSSGPGKRI